ncbi:hypothetical protein [Motiliproteus sp. SC1-56]|uniref:hypothetical protein n=1 Tax=Motiliproteus sp. SC1-56 TaxID=2799565 RepID=UPI001A90C1A7|nr:hypothetical protein [Motiliproteus sp. SC1-56]
MISSKSYLTGAALSLSLMPAVASAQSDADLAQQLANPVANLISVPLQLNYDHRIGADDGNRWTLNIQPVVPTDFSESTLLISRTIVPLVHQEDTRPGESSEGGIGDVVQSFFFSPKDSGSLTWGVGPVFLLPTATDDDLGSEKWGAGPTAVALYQAGPWTVGALGNHIWSFAGSDNRRDVDVTFVQPFVNYTTPNATSFFANLEATHDWESREWAIPINIGVNQLLKIGQQSVQIGAGLRHWLDSTPGGPEDWGLRFNLVFLFPK